MKSVMNHSFSSIPDVQLQRSKFNRSHGYKTRNNNGNNRNNLKSELKIRQKRNNHIKPPDSPAEPAQPA